MRKATRLPFVAFAGVAILFSATPSNSQPYAPGSSFPASIFESILGPRAPQLEPVARPEIVQPDEPTESLRPELRRQIVSYATREAPGTIVIDTPNTSLYYVLPGGRAIRYAIGVGREGFTWSGVQRVSRKAEWPDWIPPKEMIARQPYLPRFVAGGPTNPLGARALYLGNTQYRIHGTNDASTIGGQVSSGCIRMANEDVIDLYNRVEIGTKVVVLAMTARRNAPAIARTAARAPVREPAPVPTATREAPPTRSFASAPLNAPPADRFERPIASPLAATIGSSPIRSGSLY